jgi:hypothetical protein
VCPESTLYGQKLVVALYDFHPVSWSCRDNSAIAEDDFSIRTNSSMWNDRNRRFPKPEIPVRATASAYSFWQDEALAVQEQSIRRQV